jgi:hypothetical protein
MVAELKSDHFHKPSVLALLNTLFPPTATELPNDRMQPKVLNHYRSSLYRYITAVEASGPSVMKAFEAKLQAESDSRSWKSTWENLQLYMSLAELMIKQAEVAIDLGIDMFVGDDFTYDSPLGYLERHLLNLGSTFSDRSAVTTEGSFDSSLEGPSLLAFEGPTTRMRHAFSFSDLSLRCHSRSRVNTNYTTSPRPSILNNASFDTTGETMVDHPIPRSYASSFDTTQSTVAPSIATSARKSIYASAGVPNIPNPGLGTMPSLPRLDTVSIAGMQRSVSRPVMHFDTPDSPAAQNEAFTTTFDIPNRRILRGRQSRGDLIIDRPSTSHGEKASKGRLRLKKPSAISDEAKTLRVKKSGPEMTHPLTSDGSTIRKADEKTPAEKKNRPESKRPKTSQKLREAGVDVRDFARNLGAKPLTSPVKHPSGRGAAQYLVDTVIVPELKKVRPRIWDTERKLSPEQLLEQMQSRGSGTSAIMNQTLALTAVQKPAPLGELKRLRNVSFYDARKVAKPSPLGQTQLSSDLPVPTKSDPKNPLPFDGLAFLKKPYVEPPVIPKSLKKRPSFSSLFQRKSEGNFSENTTRSMMVEPDEVKAPSPRKPRKSILKPSQSSPTQPKLPIEYLGLDRPASPPLNLKKKKSIGDVYRNTLNKPQPADSVQARALNIGALAYPEKEGWKMSSLIEDQSVPRTPRGLDEKEFETWKDYESGVTMLPIKKVPTRQEVNQIRNNPGRYGQGKGFEGSAGFKMDGNRAPALKKKVGILPPSEKEAESAKAIKKRMKFLEIFGKDAKTYDGPFDYSAEETEQEKRKAAKESGKMRALVLTTTEERISPLLKEIKEYVDKTAPVVAAEGKGQTNLPSPKFALPELETGLLGRLRATKSTGDLRFGSQYDIKTGKKANKLVKKEKDATKSNSSITTNMVSLPRLVSLPEWEEEVENTLFKDYTRKYQIEKARAEKRVWGDLNPPVGSASSPRTAKKKNLKVAEKMGVVLEVVKEQGQSPEMGKGEGDEKKQQKRVRILNQATRDYSAEFEMPRATPKLPTERYKAKLPEKGD